MNRWAIISLQPLAQVLRFSKLPLPNAKPVSAAEDVRVQELIAELALRIVSLTQLYKLGDPIVDSFQFRRRRGKQLSPVRPGVEWSQLFFDPGHQLPDRRPVLFPGKVNRYTGLFVTRTQP